MEALSLHAPPAHFWRPQSLPNLSGFSNERCFLAVRFWVSPQTLWSCYQHTHMHRYRYLCGCTLHMHTRPGRPFILPRGTVTAESPYVSQPAQDHDYLLGSVCSVSRLCTPSLDMSPLNPTPFLLPTLPTSTCPCPISGLSLPHWASSHSSPHHQYQLSPPNASFST